VAVHTGGGPGRAGGPGAQGFSRAQVAEIKALACGLGVPISRWSSAEIVGEAVKRGDRRGDLRRGDLALAGRGCDQAMELPLLDLPRDADLPAKAGPILDLYEGRWEG
jgi:hypothetical protein